MFITRNALQRAITVTNRKKRDNIAEVDMTAGQQ
jgi:hypothetical protein